MNAPEGRYVLAALLIGGTVTFVAAQAMSRRERRKKKSRPISTWTVSKTMVKADPTTLFSGEKVEIREHISEVDEWLCRSSHWLQFCYRFDSILDENKVREGFVRTLSHIPALGARVYRNSNAIKYEFVLTPKNHGAVLEIARGRVNDQNVKLPDESSHREDWLKAGLGAPPAGFDGEPGPDDPMMRVRMTVFDAERVSYISVGISHGLGDGHSVTDVMQIWSHFCISPSLDGLADKLRNPRVFGQRVTEAFRPAKNVAELEKRIKSDVGCDINPLSKWAFYGYVVPRAIWTMSRQQVLELRISGEEMLALKAGVTEALPRGEWVSRFEILCIVLIVGQRATAGGPLPPDHNLHVGCNLRTRAKRFSATYFGNASFDFRKCMQLPESTLWDMSNIVMVAQEIHKAIRTGLADPEEITKTKDWFEAARHLGLRNTFDVWPIIFETLKSTGTFVNSWDSRWLRISMGSKQEARAFQAYFGVAQNLIVEVPRERILQDTTVHLALPPSHAKNFVEFCTAGHEKGSSLDPPLPFAIVEKEV